MKSLHEPTVFVLRHGKTEANQGSDEKSILKGTRLDLPLTDEGHEQAEKAARYIAQFPIASIKTSKMLRASQTIAHVAKATGIDATDAEWLDPLDVGKFTGMTRAAARRLIEYFIRNPHKLIPGGEKVGDWYEEFSDGLAREMRAAERSHNSPTFRAHVLGTHSCNAMATDSVVDGSGELKFYSEAGEAPGDVIKLSKKGGRWRASDVDLEGRDSDLA